MVAKLLFVWVCSIAAVCNTEVCNEGEESGSLHQLMAHASMDDEEFVQRSVPFPQWRLPRMVQKEVLEMKQAELEELAALREGQKTTGHPRVLVAGLPRTGSNALMTMANIVLLFGDSDYVPLRHMYADHEKHFNFMQFRESSNSSLLKVFTTLAKGVKYFPTVVLMSHRAPDQQLASMWKNWYTNTDVECNNPPHCKGWTNAKKEAERQACLYNSFSGKVAYDMPFELLQRNPERVLRLVSKAMGVRLGPELLEHALKVFNSTHKVAVETSPSASENMFIQSRAGDFQDLETKMTVGTSMATKQFTANLEYDVSVGSVNVNLTKWLLGKGSIDQNELWDAEKSELKRQLKLWVDHDWCRGW